MLSVQQLLDRKGGLAVSLSADAPVIDALRLMAEHHCGAVLVMRAGQLAGILSERDYARKVVLQGRNSTDTPVADIMSSPVITVAPDDRVHHCMKLMTDKRIRHLPVMDGGRVVGVVSIGDLVKAVIAEQQAEIAQLQQYITS